MDYYVTASFTVPVATEYERVWINDTLKNPPEALRMGDMPKPEPITLGFHWEMRDEHLWIYGDGAKHEPCNTEQIAEFLKLYLQQDFCEHEALGFQFAYTGSKMRPDAYGGGAIRMRKVPDVIIAGAFERDFDGVERENIETNWFLEDWSIP